MLRVSQLSRRFGGLTVLDGFDLSLRENGFTVLIGPSGCGKSTLFNVLTGTVANHSGTIEWCGQRVPHLGAVAAYMQQKDLLLPWLTLMQNALLPPRIAGADRGRAARRAAQLFRRLGLDGFEDHLPAEVSGGMRQRCALVRTLMFERDLVLLDEPLSALDAITRRSLQSLLLMLQSEFGRSVLMITHDIDEALRLADVILVLSRTPMRVLEQIDLAVPKPRPLADPQLAAVKARVLERLEKELAP